MTSAYRKARKELAEKMDGAAVAEVNRDELDGGGKRIWCIATDCPMKASVYFGSALCSWHDRASKSQWPTVTGELKATIAGGGKPRRPELKSSAESVADAAKVRAHLAEKGKAPNAFTDLSERLKARQAEREVVKGLDDDAVNAMLQAES